MNKEEINKYYPDELTTEILDELWLDMSFHKDYIKHKYEFYKLRDTYYLLQQENKQLKETLNEIYKINNQAKKDLEEIDSNPLKDDVAFRSYLQTIISLIEIKLKGGDSDE